MAVINNIFYVDNTQDRSKTPVIFLHGAGGSSLSWPATLRALSGQRYFFLDLPGHGKSEGASPHSILELAQMVIDFIDSIKIRRAVVIGHSMGGAVALWLAIHHPKRVLGLGLISTAAKIFVRPDFLVNFGNRSSFEGLVETLVKLSFSDSISPRIRDLAEKRLLLNRPTVLQNDFMACSNFDLSERIAEINLPTLIVSGANDRMIPFSNSLHMNSRIKSSQCTILDNGGHMILLEQPETITSLVTEFVKKIPYQPGSTSLA